MKNDSKRSLVNHVLKCRTFLIRFTSKFTLDRLHKTELIHYLQTFSLLNIQFMINFSSKFRAFLVGQNGFIQLTRKLKNSPTTEKSLILIFRERILSLPWIRLRFSPNCLKPMTPLQQFINYTQNERFSEMVLSLGTGTSLFRDLYASHESAPRP